MGPIGHVWADPLKTFREEERVRCLFRLYGMYSAAKANVLSDPLMCGGFVGGLAIRKLMGTPACRILLRLEHYCCRHCSHLTVAPLVPDNLPRSPPISPLTLPLTSPPPAHPSSFTFALVNSFSPFNTHPLFFPSPLLSFLHLFLLVFVSSPLTCRVGLPCLSFFAHCALSLSLW